jgi:uncharacterized membrane protein required for colicin V production
MTNFGLVDLIFIGVLLVSALMGWGRGFIMVLTGFVIFIVTTIVASRYADQFAIWMNRTWGVQAKLESMLSSKLSAPTGSSFLAQPVTAATQQAAQSLLHILAFLLICIGLGWVLSLVGRIVSRFIQAIPLVGTVNRLLGSAALVLEAVLLIAFVVGFGAPALVSYGPSTWGSAILHAQSAPFFKQVYAGAQAYLYGWVHTSGLG